ncbi:hypothetical protein HY643_03435 [Candidatus Woesearchaeota archaeon]|nr:hypothetical protein [Candidatus Woesearchaeota archaeon]
MEKDQLGLVRRKAKGLAERAALGSCVETNKELVRELNSEHIRAYLTNLPKQNHIVTTVRIGKEYVIDPLLTKDYGVGNGEVLFTKKEHEKLMQEVAKKTPFKFYMDKKVVYKKAKKE